MICSASMRLVYFTLKSLLLIYYTSISQTDFFMHFSTIRSARNATTTVIIIITTSIHIGVIASMVSPYAFPISAACSAISLVRSVHITIVRPNGIKAKRRYEIRTPAILLLPIARRITSVIIPISNINPQFKIVPSPIRAQAPATRNAKSVPTPNFCHLAVKYRYGIPANTEETSEAYTQKNG